MSDDRRVVNIDDARILYTPPPLRSDRTLSDEHREQLRGSGLTDDTILAAGLYTVTSHEEIAALLGRTRALPSPPALAIPLYIPGGASPYAYRVRADVPRRSRDKTGRETKVKYDQPQGAIGVLVYYPPLATKRAAWANTEEPLYFTEGEKKAIALDQLGYACVGLTGVWNYSAKGNKHALHDRLTSVIRLEGRRCCLVWDADSHDPRKPEILMAARRLVRLLLAAGASQVLFTTPPERGGLKGIDDWYAAKGEAEVREVIAQAWALPGEGTQGAVSDLPYTRGLKAIEGLVLPRGYTVEDSGRLLSQTGDKTVEVGPRPMFLIRLYADHLTGEQRADVVLRDARGWRTVSVTRKALVDTRTMMSELAPLGAPITSNTAKHVASWFLAFEVANDNALQPLTSVSRTGWCGDAFVSHTPLYEGEDPALVVSSELARVSAALTPRGDAASHERALMRAWEASPYVRLAICAALATPMLARLDLKGFAVHLCGDSSRGKTTMLRIAASIFGDPEDASWVSSWNTTANAAELRAVMLNDLPQFYDELGTTDPQQAERLAYTLINGESRGRVTREVSMRRSHTWRTIVLSTGETDLVSERTAVGAQARVLTVEVDGWGLLDGDAAAIDELRRECTRNAGCFGERWLRLLVSYTREEWAAMREEHAQLKARLEAGSPIAKRMADYRALLALVERRLLVSGWAGDVDAPSMLGSEHDGANAVPKTVGEHMADVLQDLMRQRPDAFPKGHRVPGKSSIHVPGNGGRERIGIQVYDAPDDGALVETLLIRTALQELCEKHQKSLRNVLKDWAAKGWILTSRDGAKERTEQLRTIGDEGRSRWVVWVRSDGGE